MHSAGKRITLPDWAECPGCKFACSARQFTRILAVERRCPMCNDEIGMGAVHKIPDPIGNLRKKAEAVAGLSS